MIRARHLLESFAKDGRESRKLAIDLASHLPSATRHFRTNAPIIFSGLLADFSRIFCMHRRLCVISLTGWSSWGKTSPKKTFSSWSDSTLLFLATARHLRLLQIVANGHIACKRGCIQSKDPFDLTRETCWKNSLLHYVYRQLYRGGGYFCKLISVN